MCHDISTLQQHRPSCTSPVLQRRLGLLIGSIVKVPQHVEFACCPYGGLPWLGSDLWSILVCVEVEMDDRRGRNEDMEC